MTVLHGDCRFYNNIFVQKEIRKGMQEIHDGNRDAEWTDGNIIAGTYTFDFCPTQKEWEAQFEGYCGMGSAPSDRYYNPLPVWAGGNVYFNGAVPMKKETDAVKAEGKAQFSLTEANGKWTFKTNVYEIMPEIKDAMICTETLGMAFEPEMKYENPDGSPITVNVDYFDNGRGVNPMPGPFEGFTSEVEIYSDK